MTDKEAIETLKNYPCVCKYGTSPINCADTECDFGKAIRTLVERPTGKWEIVDAEGSKIWNCVCTECGHDPQEYIGGTENWWLRKTHLPNFCPNCGVRIVNVKGGDV